VTVPIGPRRYRIILRGECGPLMAGVLDDVLVESCRGWTCVMALVRDDSELYGLLARFGDFALHVVSLNELGADVPLFIFGMPAFAQGIGEVLESVSLPPTWFVVVTPPVQVATAEVFAAPELTRNSRSAKMCVFSEGYGRNDLQAVATSRFPEIAASLDALSSEAAGAASIAMSGSGACVFAAFSAEQAALQTLARVERAGRAGFAARALNHHPLLHFAAS